MRKAIAIWMNLLVPGTGLILLRREWLGLAMAMLFCVCAQVGLWGWLIVPASIPGWITVSSLAGAVLTWIGAQYTLVLRMRLAFGPGIDRELARLCRRAEQALAHGHFDKAEELLLVAMTLDDEATRVNTLWAQLMTALGRFHRARQAWHRVVQLSGDGPERRRAVEALAALP